jgi:hypothetical protein
MQINFICTDIFEEIWCNHFSWIVHLPWTIASSSMTHPYSSYSQLAAHAFLCLYNWLTSLKENSHLSVYHWAIPSSFYIFLSFLLHYSFLLLLGWIRVRTERKRDESWGRNTGSQKQRKREIGRTREIERPRGREWIREGEPREGNRWRRGPRIGTHQTRRTQKNRSWNPTLRRNPDPILHGSSPVTVPVAISGGSGRKSSDSQWQFSDGFSLALNRNSLGNFGWILVILLRIVMGLF